MFGRVTALHFACFLPSLDGIVPLTAEVSLNADGEPVPGALYRQGSGDEVPAEDTQRAAEAADEACEHLWDLLHREARPEGRALLAVLEAERALHAAAQAAKEALYAANLGSIGWGLSKHESPDNGSKDTPGLRALEEYVAHLAEKDVPRFMLERAEAAEAVHAEDVAEVRAEWARDEEAEYLAERRAERGERYC